jgi:hypothetical protein
MPIETLSENDDAVRLPLSAEDAGWLSCTSTPDSRFADCPDRTQLPTIKKSGPKECVSSRETIPQLKAFILIREE